MNFKMLNFTDCEITVVNNVSLFGLRCWVNHLSSHSNRPKIRYLVTQNHKYYIIYCIVVWTHILSIYVLLGWFHYTPNEYHHFNDLLKKKFRTWTVLLQTKPRYLFKQVFLPYMSDLHQHRNRKRKSMKLINTSLSRDCFLSNIISIFKKVLICLVLL